MKKKIYLFIAVIFTTIFIDQAIKQIFLGGYEFRGSCFSLILVYNKGVAFSMFESLGVYLKYIQIVFLLGILGYVVLAKDVFKEYYIPIALILGAGVSNVYDRFIHGGVVDYFYWHCGFDFAIFNFADVMIDLGIVLLVIKMFRKKPASS
ncbi:MAG: signal peptidase II [Campylobacterales bacterium]